MQAIHSGLQVSFCLAIRKRIKYAHIKHVPRDRRLLHTGFRLPWLIITWDKCEVDRPAVSELMRSSGLFNSESSEQL